MFGYNADEAPLPIWKGDHFDNKGKQIKIDKTLEIKRYVPVSNRPVVAVSLGPHLDGAAAPRVNPGHTETSALGAVYRVGRDMDPPQTYNTKYRKEFKEFVKTELAENFTPLSRDTDLSHETFIENAPYPQWRKKELVDKWKLQNFNWETAGTPWQYKKWFKLKCFIKDEPYIDWKVSRGIYSRLDEAKNLFGPICQQVANKIMKECKHFIKYIPVKDRPQFILDMIDNLAMEFVSSDFTSFEAHFTKGRMIDCEIEMFRYMLRDVPHGKKMCDFLQYAKCINPNICIFKFFTFKIEAKRMSGEMDTSLSNGFSNLMWLKFAMKKHNMDFRRIPIVVEGDDALCCLPGKIPQSFFQEFGLDLKIEIQDKVEHASFCGLVFDKDDKCIITDIFDTVANFGWTKAVYFNSKKSTLQAILRCKALSLAYQYKGCPILTALAKKYLLLTTGVCIKKVIEDRRFIDQYYFAIMQEALEYLDQNELDKPIGLGSRNLVEKLYGITIADQILIEKEIDAITDLDAPLKLPVLMKYSPKSYMDYFSKFAVLRQTRDFNGIDLLFPKVCETNNTFLPL